MRNVKAFRFEEGTPPPLPPFPKRAGSLPTVEECLLCSTSHLPLVVFLFVPGSKTTTGKVLPSGVFQISTVERQEREKKKKSLLIRFSRLLDVEAGGVHAYSSGCTRSARTPRSFINILMISSVPRSLASGTTRCSRITKTISSE